jgi:hypothetical protein
LAVDFGGVASEQVPELGRVLQPAAAVRAVYDERCRTYLEIHKRMRPPFRRIDKGAP